MGLGRFHLKTAYIFAVIAAVFGLYFVFRTPLLWGTDETSHVARVYQISEGHIWSKYVGDRRDQGGYGDRIPFNLYWLILYTNFDLNNNAGDADHPQQKDVGDPTVYTELGSRHLDTDKRVVYGFPNSSAYSPIAYAPGVIGMVLAKLAHANIFWTIMLVRLFDLAFFIGVITFALLLLNDLRLKWLFFVIALLPTTLYSGAIISTDGTTTAVVLLFAAIICKGLLYPGKVLTTLEKWLLASITVLLPLFKPGYILLLPLQLLMLNKQTIKDKRVLLYSFGSLVIAGILFLLWSHSVAGPVSREALIRPGPGWEAVQPNEQTAFILHHPFSYLAVLFRTYIINDNQYFMELVGDLGFHHVRLPGIGLAAQLIALLVALAVAEKNRLRRIVPFSFIGVAVISGLIIATSFYLTYSDVAGPLLRGVQGRYFIPFLPFVLLGIGILLRDRFTIANPQAFYKLAPKLICVLMLVGLTMISIKYQLVTWG